MDHKEEIETSFTINDGFKLINKRIDKNIIVKEMLKCKTVDEKKIVLKKYLDNVNDLDEEKMIELSEAILYMIEKSTFQKSLMIGNLKEENTLTRTTDGVKISSKDKCIVVPYNKIKNEVIGKQLAKKIRKVL